MNDFTELMDFSNNNVYMLFAIARSKSNDGVTAKQQVVIRELVRSVESFPHKLAKIKNAAELRNLKFYIYISANARDTKKSYANFKHKLSEYELQAMFGQTDYAYQLSRLHKVWYSALMQPNARATKYFLVDIDTKAPSTLQTVRNRVNNWNMKGNTSEILLEQETRNGYHFIIRRMDVRVLQNIENVEVKTDGLLFLDSIGFDEE